jgi:hypothetical protein
MGFHRRIIRPNLALVVLCTISGILCGCAVVGPTSISMGRADYNEAINRTEDAQMLMSIVRGRYGETFSLLAVTGVAASVSFGTNAGVNIGFGPDENYAGNLVPFSGGLAYEENPTITYAPVQGEQYLRELLSPIPPDILLLILRSVPDPGHILTLLVKKINELQNPDFLPNPPAEPDPRFMRYVELTTELHKAGVMLWVEDARKEVEFDVLISGYAPKYSQAVREYLALLGLPLPVDESKDIVLPVYFAVKGRELGGIGVSTRSTIELIEILRAAIEIPQEHENAGIAINYPPIGLAGKDILIRSSKNKPKTAFLAEKYRGHWFYIEETDQPTKLFFRSVRLFWSVSIASSGTPKIAAPVLTIPVSK